MGRQMRCCGVCPGEIMFLRVWMILLLAALASGCAQDRLVDTGRTGLDHCCVDNERTPAWLVKIVEPAAPIAGRIIGHIAWRRGRLDSGGARQAVLSRLRPMDIVLVSSKGRLSGHTIPGMFQHAAVYVGNERDLRALGAWDHPAAKPLHNAIRAGGRFVEADQGGVHVSPPERVLNTDRVVIIRPSIPTPNWKRRSALRLFERVGEPFDFHFDMSTPKVVFCVELICHAIPELGLPRQMVYGRPTIVPDSIALRMIRGNRRLNFVAYIRGSSDAFDVATLRQLAADLAVQWAPTRRPAKPAEIAAAGR